MLILACHYLLTTRGYLSLPPVCYFKTRNSLLNFFFFFLLKLLDDIRACPSLSRCLPASGFTPLLFFRHVAFTPLPNLPACGFYTTSKSSGMWLLHHFQIFRHVAFILATAYFLMLFFLILLFLFAAS